MTEMAPRTASDNPVSVLVLPHRSLTRAGLAVFLAAQSLAAGGFAVVAAWRGNVFAPAFAVLELGVVAYCLARVWSASAKGQIITLTPSQLNIAATSGAAPANFHPYWVRVRLEPGRWRGWPSRLLVGSHGREVEIGAFLNDEERRELAQRLTELLRPLQDRDGPSELEDAR
jgi:uncharacterized membrane protein